MDRPYVIYPHDIGYLHVLDFTLHRARRWLAHLTPAIPLPPHPSRYLDGEEDLEGTYR